MSTFRIFGFSLLMTVVALVTGYLHGGPTALFLLAVLALLEVSLSSTTPSSTPRFCSG